MLVEVNGARLYVDVEGAGLVPDGARMRAKPTLILLHGGPGFDHSMYKPAFSALSDLAQILYLDHRGNGRSTGNDPATWNLSQWGDDVKGLCDTLGIEKPIVFGASFGGFVAQSYATRHPQHPAGLILASTAAKVDFSAIFRAFEQFGGLDARQVAEAYWRAPTSEARTRYLEQCMPLYRARQTGSAQTPGRAIRRDEVAIHFNGPENEHGQMDFRSALAAVQCPTLVMSGDRDPITPPVFGREIVRCLPPHLASFELFPGSSHQLLADDPDHTMAVLRDFIVRTNPHGLDG